MKKGILIPKVLCTAGLIELSPDSTSLMLDELKVNLMRKWYDETVFPVENRRVLKATPHLLGKAESQTNSGTLI